MNACSLAGIAPAGPRAGFWKPVPNVGMATPVHRSTAVRIYIYHNINLFLRHCPSDNKVLGETFHKALRAFWAEACKGVYIVLNVDARKAIGVQ